MISLLLNTKVMVPVVIVIAVLLFLSMGYVKAPPDRAFIISGLKKEPKILIGRAGIRIPFLERMDKLYLGQMTVDIKTEQSVPTNDFINVNVDAVAKVRIEPTSEGIKLAAKNFLNKDSIDITRDLQDSLQGNIREIIGTLTLKAINTDRDSFSDQVMEKASKDMQKLGIEIVSCNIQNVTDENGLIKDLGADNTSLIKKNAAIAKAQAEKDIAVAQAEADRLSNEAQVLAQTKIAEMNTDLLIKKAELQTISDTKKAQADAAYEIQRQAQEKTVQTATIDAQIAKAEREEELNKQQVSVVEQYLQAEIHKKADAERYAIEQKAAAELAKRQREAEAAAIQAKALAEAEGMEKKAEAYKKYTGAAIAEMMIKALPELAGEIAKPLSQIDKITIIGGNGDTDSAVGSISGNVPSVMLKVFETLKETTGVDMAEIMKADTYDAKVNKNINITGITDSLAVSETIEKVSKTDISSDAIDD